MRMFLKWSITGRIAYANEHFGGQLPGWKSDRGRVYIMFGRPDSVTTVPAGLDCDNVDGPVYGVVHEAPAHETWLYHYVEGIGEEVSYDFVAPKPPESGRGGRLRAWIRAVSQPLRCRRRHENSGFIPS